MNSVTGLTTRRLMWVIWPAFLVACLAELVFFSVFDPFDLHFFGEPLDISREAIYTMGFFGFWGLGVASSALTMFLERPPVNIPDVADGGDEADGAEGRAERNRI